ncbi:MAG TPA: hypothetical protein VFJ58_27300 [Armatimonadota bacterium]|nr:hypothetical protein [Armatimonadota bacterium]
MATDREWANGYFQQAAADMRAASDLRGAAPSVVAMLVQMALEKFGKAALLRSGQFGINSARGSRRGASKMVRVLTRNHGACRRLGYSGRSIEDDLLPLIYDLERSHPVLNRDGPHLEYPWETPAGQIEWPAQHLAVGRRFRPENTQGIRLIKFLQQLCDRFDRVFL